MIKKENYTFTPVDSQMFHFDLYILNSYSTNLKKISLWTLTHETSESVKFLDPPPTHPRKKKKKKLLSKILEINLKDVWKPKLFWKLFKIKKNLESIMLILIKS